MYFFPPLPLHLQYVTDKAWIDENFPKDIRYEIAMIIGPNVLTAEYIQYVSTGAKVPVPPRGAIPENSLSAVGEGGRKGAEFDHLRRAPLLRRPVHQVRKVNR